MKPLKLLNRLFSRGVNSNVLSALYSEIYNQPICAEPAFAKSIIDGYLHGTIEPAAMSSDNVLDGETRLTYKLTDNIAVMDISGALSSRRISGYCGSAPISYEEILSDFRSIQANTNITDLFIQFSSGGGSAINMCDLSDVFYNARGKGLKITAIVSTMAASAAYGIASACDEIIITRNAAVGSIGTYICLQNDVKANEMAGIEFTYVVSDAHKIDGSPDVPLTDSAKQGFQDDVIAIDTLFKETIARNRGLDVSAIYAMEARCYRGELAITAGLADRISTFEEVVNEILTKSEKQKIMTITAENFAAQGEQISQLVKSMSDLTGIVSQMAQEPAAKANESAIADMCAAASVPDTIAKLLIKSGATIEEVRASLIDSQAEKSETIKIDGFLSAKLQGEQPPAALDSFSSIEALEVQRKQYIGAK
ncbi:MAG: S49 family peptidase [Methylococcales bacterium]|nr:S49 family peptidase [Methylococcales bacterium]